MPSMTTQKPNLTAGSWSSDVIDQLPDSSFAYIANDGSRYLPFKDEVGKVALPQVRNALAHLDQTDAIPSETRASIRTNLQNSLKASDATDTTLRSFHAIQADANTGQLPSRVMLLRAGNFHTEKYGEVPLSVTDLQEMKTNFEAGIGMADDGKTGIPVDYAHQSHLNAAAWIKGLEVEGDALFGTNIEFSGSGKKAIQDKEYKCLSSDFYPAAFGEWVDPESGIRAKNVIVGAALTNRPMFTGNQTVIASEARGETGTDTNKTIYVIASQVKETSMNIDQLRVKAAEDVSGAEQRYLQANADKLSADERKKFEIAEPVKADDTKEQPKKVEASSVKGTEGVVAIEASEVKAMQDRIGSLEASTKEVQRAAIKADVMKHASRGAIKADRIESWTGTILAADETTRKELLADLEALSANPVLAKEQGSGDADETNTGAAREQLMVKATEIVKASDGKTDIKMAYEAAKTANPELAAQAVAEGKTKIEASADQFAAAGVNRG